jgi:predicted DCC family thiol-disulfide oxidoreductase YuxK
MNSQFTLFRIIFGSFLTWHFLALIPYGTELFSNEGLIGDATLNPTYGLFPNPLYIFDSPFAVFLTLGLAVAASVSFTLGKAHRTSAIVLWFVVTALFHRNNLTGNPSLPYLGLMLLLSALIPPVRKGEPWKMPSWILPVATLLLAIGYSFSGYTKLFSPSWIDGTAIAHVLNNPLARPGFFRDFFLGMPGGILAVMTWGALLAELLYLPLCLFRKTRPWIWLALVGMHVSLMFLIDFTDLSMGMIMIHLFTFDPKWLPAKGKTRVAFDADCLMCNGFVSFLSHEDRQELLSFEPLPNNGGKTTLLVTKDGILHKRSNAVLTILDSLGGHWRAIAIIGKIIPRPIRDLCYRIIAANRHSFGKRKICKLPSAEVRRRIAKVGILMTGAFIVLSSCNVLNVERPPGGIHLHKSDAAFIEVMNPRNKIQAGDIVAFQMPKKEAMARVRKGEMQKLPYGIFTYGHLALIVEKEGEMRLLQLAMKQAANIDSGLDFLSDKKWKLFRPTAPVDKARLAEFVETVLANASNPKRAYDYSGVIGLRNRSTTPDSPDEIACEYTCVTLVQAALHYAGHPTRSIHRHGILDIVTPAQLINSARTK